MATPVFVSEEYGFDTYINLVVDPENPRPDELGAHLDIGPAPCEWNVHYHMDEISSSLRIKRWEHLTDDTIRALVSGKDCPFFISMEATKVAQEKLDCTTSFGIHNAWQEYVLEGLRKGELLNEPQWMSEYKKETRLNAALSNSYSDRMAILFELVLDGMIPIYQYESAVPNMSEVATICMRAGVGRDNGKDMYSSWRDEFNTWTPKQVAYAYGLITGQAAAINEHTLHYVCSSLSHAQSDTVIPLMHFMRVKHAFIEEFHEQRTQKFEDILTDAQVIVGSLMYASEWVEDNDTPWQDLEDQYGVWNETEDVDASAKES